MDIAKANYKYVLWVGDIISLGLVTVIGFASHGTLAESGFRMLTTFIPLLISWLIAGYLSNSFFIDRARIWNQYWRSILAMLTAVPLAMVIRSFLLDSRPIIPLFALVMTGVSMVGIAVWRFIFNIFLNRIDGQNG